MMWVRTVEVAWGAAIGTAAAYKFQPIAREAARSYAIFRKSWMRWPIQATVFGAAFFIGGLLPTRLFRKFDRKDKGISHEVYTGRNDIVGRFRLFDEVEVTSEHENYKNYLAAYSSEALTKPELAAQLLKNSTKDVDIGELFRVKRLGKDLDDIFWHFGKVHGLENIAFASTDEVLATGGNPVSLQNLVNKYEGRQHYFSSADDLEAHLKETALQFSATVDKMNLEPSDAKKLKALPYYMAKRQELPEPKRG